MAEPTFLTADDEIVKCCANQKTEFVWEFTPAVGVDFTGAVVTCQILKNIQSTVATLSPTVSTSVLQTGVLQASFSWTEAQSSVLVADGAVPTEYDDYIIQVGVALAADATHEALRFIGTLRVYPGGNA